MYFCENYGPSPLIIKRGLCSGILQVEGNDDNNFQIILQTNWIPFFCSVMKLCSILYYLILTLNLNIFSHIKPVLKHRSFNHVVPRDAGVHLTTLFIPLKPFPGWNSQWREPIVTSDVSFVFLNMSGFPAEKCLRLPFLFRSREPG